jgi:hypothetical protein
MTTLHDNEIRDEYLGEWVDRLRKEAAEAQEEWEKQNYTLVKVQLGHMIERTFAINKESLQQVIYLLEMLSR